MVTRVVTAEPRVTRPLPVVVVARAPRSGTLIHLPAAIPPPIIGIIYSQRYLLAKRAVDIVLSALLLLVALVVMLPLAVLIKLDSKGPVLYRQRRVGQDGARFDMLKFRSMHTNSDDKLHRQAIARYMRGEALNADGPGHAQFKLARDPRVTRVGHFLRKTSLDELPQLWNVLKGDMSLVGPRPPIPYEVAEYSKRANTRLLGKPGLTGPWQVYGRSRVPFDEMVEMDIAYLQRQSIREDLKLIALTAPAILFGWGAA